MVAISHNFSANIAKSKTLDLNDLTSVINLILVEKKIIQNEIVLFYIIIIYLPILSIMQIQI